MKARILLYLLLAGVSTTALGQTDEDLIKQVIETETESWAKGDYDTWQSSWVHSPNVSHVVPFTNFAHQGWESVNEWLRPAIADRDEFYQGSTVRNNNYDIRLYKKNAWVAFTQERNLGGETSKTHEVRLMEKEKEGWKIAAVVTSPQYSRDADFISENLYWSAHALYEMERMEDAIRVLTTGAELFPESYRFHTFLGGIYSEKGQSTKAVEHIKHAFAIAPESQKEGIQAMLEEIDEEDTEQ